jgi:hypothetical protein
VEKLSWGKVGEWVKSNAGTGVRLVGSLLTGNAPSAVAAGIALVSSATGTNDPLQALETLQRDPNTVVKLKELYYKNEDSVRNHIQTMAELEVRSHETTQETIRSGDNAEDVEVRRTRPTMAKQSWTATIGYCIGCFGIRAIAGNDLFDLAIAGILFAPAGAYLGLRTGDKFAQAWRTKK